MWMMTWHALSARPNLVRVAASVVIQKPGRDGGVKGFLAGGDVNASASANNSRQHIGGGLFVKRGGEHGQRLDRGADVSRRSLQSDHQRVFAEQVVVGGRPLLVGSGRYCRPRHRMPFNSRRERA